MLESTAAEVVLGCAELDPTLRFFCDELGFVLKSILPADRPRRAVVEAHGLRLCLEAGSSVSPGTIRLRRTGESLPAKAPVLIAPNGTRVEIVAPQPSLELPELRPELVVTQPGDDWRPGRAGMRYRDLIPGRQGGRFIASHIMISEGGDVPDYPHKHRIRFQMIYCQRGWVRVVYEDQGPPFVMRAGDAVLQPPGILHRVLECSPGLEVVEIGCPAEHETLVEIERSLPTDEVAPDRLFGEQLFVRHDSSKANWQPWQHAGFRYRDTGIAAATHRLVDARIVQTDGADHTERTSHGGELLFGFVTSGTATLEIDGRPPQPLTTGTAMSIPPEQTFALAGCSSDFELLEVRCPAV